MLRYQITLCVFIQNKRKEENKMSKKPVVLMVLDGYGLNENPEGNAVAMANTPVMDK